MKATGIVRRIDDLGRVVIPKEIRRTLRIRESDALEIFTDREGEIILKKYSPLGEMGIFAKKYAESLAQVSGHVAVITDRDQIIAVSGGMKQLAGKDISPELEDRLDQRQLFAASKGERGFLMISDAMNLNEDAECVQQVVCPIICEGDVIGAVMLLGIDPKKKMGDAEQKMIQSASIFLGRQMEQ